MPFDMSKIHKIIDIINQFIAPHGRIKKDQKEVF